MESRSTTHNLCAVGLEHRSIRASFDRDPFNDPPTLEQKGLQMQIRLEPEDVQWITNDLGELGVKIGDQFFFLYKGRSLVYGIHGDDPTIPPKHDDKDGPMHWRPVGKLSLIHI